MDNLSIENKITKPGTPNLLQSNYGVNSSEFNQLVNKVKEGITELNTVIEQSTGQGIVAKLAGLSQVDKLQSSAVTYSNTTVKEVLDSLLNVDRGDLLIQVFNSTLRVEMMFDLVNALGVIVHSGTTTLTDTILSVPVGKYSLHFYPTGYSVVSAVVSVDNFVDDNVTGITGVLNNIDIGVVRTDIVINLIPMAAPTLNGVSINGGATTSATSSLSITLDTIGIVEQYRISKTEDFLGAVWTDYVTPIPYTFEYDSPVTLTLFVQVKNRTGSSVILSDSINMINGIIRSDSSLTYNSLTGCLNAIIAQYGANLTQDVTITCIAPIHAVRPSGNFYYELTNFNNNSDYLLTILGQNFLNIDCDSLGGIKIQNTSNVRVSGINFTSVSNFENHVSPDEVCALFIEGNQEIVSKNIVIDSCNIDGQIIANDGLLGNYGIVIKNIDNASVVNTLIKHVGSYGIDAYNLGTLTLSGVEFQNCTTVDPNYVSQPCLLNAGNIQLCYIEDSILDGTGMYTGVIGSNIDHLICKRSKFINTRGEAFRLANTVTSKSLKFDGCLIAGNLYNPLYEWTKQIIYFGNIDLIEIINSTIRLTSASDLRYYVSLFNGLQVNKLVTYNNIFDFYFPSFASNSAEAFLYNIDALVLWESDYNLYRDYIKSTDVIANNFCVVDTLTSMVGLDRISSLAVLQALGLELNSTLISNTTSLFTSGYNILDSVISALPISTAYMSAYDLPKNTGTPCVGCYFQSYTVPVEGLPSYVGINTLNNTAITQYVSAIVYSGSDSLFMPIFSGKGEVFKWIFNSPTDTIIKYGVAIISNPISVLDEFGEYLDINTYSISVQAIGGPMTLQASALTVKQAMPDVNFSISNVFPLVGEDVTMVNTSNDIDSHYWMIDNGTSVIQEYNSETVHVTPVNTHKLYETLVGTNTVQTNTKVKYIYPMLPPEEAYYEFTLDKEVARVSDTVVLTLINKYNYTGIHTVAVDVINHITGAVITTYNPTGSTLNISGLTRGIYDIEVRATTGTFVVYFKQDMILTITPDLALIANAWEHVLQPKAQCLTFYGTPFSICDGSNYNYTNVPIPAGTTIVVTRDPAYPVDSIYRLRFQNLIGTAENPIIITINQATPLQIGFESYYGVFLENCQHVVLDGRGYQNLQYGIEIFPNALAASTLIALQGGLKSSNVEILGVECHEAGFSGISFKTDPDVDDPTTWRPVPPSEVGFTQYDLKVHHNYMHNTDGEGFYLGYFSSETQYHTNSLGEAVSYRAHKMIDTKVYRNTFYRCGWDSVQVNNAYGATEIAHNTLIDTAWYGQPNQSSGISTSLEGKIYGNTIIGGNGPGIQMGLLGATQIFNNIIVRPEGQHCIYLLGSVDNPEQAVIPNNVLVDIFNNNLITDGGGCPLGSTVVIDYNNVVLTNNIMKYLGNMYYGQSAELYALWDALATHNVRLVSGTDYKIGSVEDNNFNLYPDSILTNSGAIKAPLYDIRGYRNWVDNDKFIGAYAGIVKLPDSVLSINSLTINSGATNTNNRVVSLGFTLSGIPTHYMVSESATFVDAVWVALANPFNFTLSTGEGTKTIYVRLKNNSVVSNSVSNTIFYAESQKYLVSFNEDNPVYDSVAPWNNCDVAPLTTGLVLEGLKDQYAVVSGMNIVIDDAYDTIISSANLSDPLFYPYLNSAVRFNWRVTALGSDNDKFEFRITGCSPDKVYDVLMYSDLLYNGHANFYYVNGVKQVYQNNVENKAAICTYNNVLCDVNGDITITVKPWKDTDWFFGDSWSVGGDLGLIDVRSKSNIPILSSVDLNNGDTTTTSTLLSLNLSVTRIPSEYMVSENPSFTGAVWKPYYSNIIPYTLGNKTIGVKTIYVKVKNSVGTSATVSDTITYNGTQLELTSGVINYGAAITTSNAVTVALVFTGGTPVSYRVGELSDLSDATWKPYVTNIVAYELDFEVYGSKTIYSQVQDTSTVSSIVSDTITYQA